MAVYIVCLLSVHFDLLALFDKLIDWLIDWLTYSVLLSVVCSADSSIPRSCYSDTSDADVADAASLGIHVTHLSFLDFCFHIGSGWNLAGPFFKKIRIDWRSRVFDFLSHFQDGGHDVISRRKVLPSGECTHSVRLVPAASAVCCICSGIRPLLHM